MSRPRKEILVISDCALDAANLAYVLRIRLHVDPWTLPSEIDRLPQDPCCLVLLCRRSPGSILPLARQTAKAYPEIPVLYIALENDAQQRGDLLHVTTVMHKPSMNDQIEALRLMVARKRGPKGSRPQRAEQVTA